MPKIRAKEFNVQTANVASVTVVMPPHEVGDLFLVFAGKDDATGTDPTTATANWLRGGSGVSAGATTAAVRAGWFVSEAITNDEPPIVITSSDSDTWSIIAISIQGVGVTKTITGYSWSGGSTTYNSTAHGFTTGAIVNITGMTPSAANGIFAVTATAADTFTVVDANPGAYSSGGSAKCLIDNHSGNGNTDATGAPFAVTGVTTNYDKSLVFFANLNSATGCSVPYPGLMYLDAVDTAADGLGVGYTVQRTAGATGSKDFYADAVNANTIGFCVAVRDSGEGYEQPYFDSDYATLVDPFRGSAVVKTSDAWAADMTRYVTMGKQAVSACFQQDSSGGPSYVSYTTEANNSTDADVIPYPAVEAAGASGTGDCFMIGYTKPFMSLQFDRAGCTQGVAGVVAWEYYNGSTWTTVVGVSDATTGFTSAVADAQVVRWSMPTSFNWKKASFNGSASLFWVRARCTTLWTTNPTISQVFIGGAAVIFDAVGASTDAGVIQYENAANVTPAAGAAQVGCTYLSLGSTVALAAGDLLVGTYQFTLPRDYVDSARFKEGGGVHFMIANSSLNRKHWAIGNFRDNQTSDAQRNRYVLSWDQATDTTMSDTTTAFASPISDVLIGNLSPRGAGSVAFSHLINITPANLVVNGGSSTHPVSVTDLIAMGEATNTPLFRDFIFFAPVTFGGSGSMAADLNGFTFSFPTVATPWDDLYADDVYSQAHVDTGVLGFRFDARSGDQMWMTDGKISSDSTWQFNVLSTASSSADWDFSGMLIINANVTLRDVFTWDDIKWQSCPSFTTNGATMTNQTFVNTKVSVASPAQAALISDSSFTKTTGTQHGIEISGSAADFDLSGVSFTGYAGSNGSTGNEAIYVNIASGTMTISILAGGDTPSIRTAGATVNVVANTTITLTGLVDGSEVRVYDSGDNSVIDGTESTSGGEFAFSSASGNVVYIRIFHTSYLPADILDYTIPGTDAEVPVSQVFDRNYQNP